MAEHSILHETLAAAGAVFVEEMGFRVADHFGDSAAEYHHARAGTVLADESQRGKVDVRGADAGRFLHNLTTNDILALPPGGGCEAFLTTTKAKVIAYLLIYRQESSTFSLDIAPGTAGKAIEYLDRYLISEQVEFVDRTQEYAQMHLAGPHCSSVLGQFVGEGVAPSASLRHGAARFGGAVDCRLRRHDALGLPGYDIICPADRAADVWRQLTEAGVKPIGRQACEILRIEAGIPHQGADITEDTFAPEVGRSAETICYTKGCYLGQESIVMARDRGQVNRRLAGVKLPNGPVPHDSPLMAQTKQVGRVTSSAFSPRLGVGVGLAYVRRGHQQPGTVLQVEVGDNRAPAEVIELPV